MATRDISFAASSNIDQITYDDDQQTLQVRFKQGKSYAYTGVPSLVADGFQTAESAGKYLNSSIKGQYPANEV